MKSFKVKLGLTLLLLVFALSFFYGQEQGLSSAEKHEAGYKTVVSNLKELIDSTPSLKAQINESIKIQDETSYWHNKTSDDFIKFFDEWLVYNPLPKEPGKYIRIFDQLANSGAGEILFNNNVFSSWFIAFLDARGEYLGTESSAATLSDWMSAPVITIDDYIVPEGGFTTFNEFFLRAIKPEAKPLDGENDPSVIVSPADGAIRQVYAGDLDTNFKVKRDVINIRQALNNSPYADRFIGGEIVDILLWFTDYHHFHAPVSGKIVAYGEYPGSYNYNFGKVDWDKKLAKHKRLYYIFQTEKFGFVAMIPVGFWGVGSIVSEYSSGDYVKKGDKIGHFEYGGSSIILIFEPDAIKFTIPVGDKSVAVEVRKKIGEATK